MIFLLQAAGCSTSLLASPHDFVGKLSKFEDLLIRCVAAITCGFPITESSGQSKERDHEPNSSRCLLNLKRDVTGNGLEMNAMKLMVGGSVHIGNVWQVCYAYVGALPARINGLSWHLCCLEAIGPIWHSKSLT